MTTTAAMQRRGPYAVDLRVLAELEKNKLAMRANAVGGTVGGDKGKEKQRERASSAHQKPSARQTKVVKRRPVSATTAELGLRSAADQGGARGNMGNVVLNGIAAIREKDSAVAARPRAASGTKRSSWARKKENMPLEAKPRAAGRSGAAGPSASGSAGGRSGGKAAPGLDNSKHTTEIGTLRSIYTQSHTKPSSVAAGPGRPRSSLSAWGAPPPTLEPNNRQTLAPVSLPTAPKEPLRASNAPPASRSASSSRPAAETGAAPPVLSRSGPSASPSPSPDAEILMESTKARATMPELVAKYRNAPSFGDLDGGAWEVGARAHKAGPSSGGRARPASAGRLRAVAAAEPDAGSVRSSAEMVREWKRSCAGGGDMWGMGKGGDAGGGGGSCPGSPGLRGSLDDGVIGLAGSNPQTPEGVVQRWKEESLDRKRSGSMSEAKATQGQAGGFGAGKTNQSESQESQEAPAGETVSRVRKKLLGSMEGATTAGAGGPAGGEARKTYTERIRGLTGATPLAVDIEEQQDKVVIQGAGKDAEKVKNKEESFDVQEDKENTEPADGLSPQVTTKQKQDTGAHIVKTQQHAAGYATQPETGFTVQVASSPPGVKKMQKLPCTVKAQKFVASGGGIGSALECLLDNALQMTVTRFFSDENLRFGGFVVGGGEQ